MVGVQWSGPTFRHPPLKSCKQVYFSYHMLLFIQLPISATRRTFKTMKICPIIFKKYFFRLEFSQTRNKPLKFAKVDKSGHTDTHLPCQSISVMFCCKMFRPFGPMSRRPNSNWNGQKLANGGSRQVSSLSSSNKIQSFFEIIL